MDTCKKSFQELKESQVTTPILTIQEGEKSFVIYCDVFDQGLRAVLM